MNSKATIELDYTPEELEDIIAQHVRETVNNQVKSISDKLIKEAIESTIQNKVQEWLNTSLENYRFEIKENNQVVLLTIEEQMQRAFISFMNEKIDDYDRPAYDGKRRINQVMNKQLRDIYDRVIKPEVAKAGAELKASLNDKLKDEVAAKMKDILFSK